VPAEQPALLNVEVAYSAHPGHMELVQLALQPGARLADSLSASGLLARHGLQPAQLRVGIWGKARELDAPLRERDRVEIYRPLRVDPKEARRQRYRKDKPRRQAAAG
jgi:putative ubiquitin-RnfH superfamily antitoxin RatB of RatAB toxin-antitoxin module